MITISSADRKIRPSTTATLMTNEATRIAQLFAETGDWARVRERVVDENLLQVRTRGSLVRLYGEASARLQELTPTQLSLVDSGTLADRRQILWIAYCRRYPFVGEFASSVVREKFLRYDLTLNDADFEAYYNQSAAWHPEILRWSPTTFKKQRAFLFRTMREANLMTQDNHLMASLLSAEVVSAIREDDARLFYLFTVTNQEISAWTRL